MLVPSEVTEILSEADVPSMRMPPAAIAVTTELVAGAAAGIATAGGVVGTGSMTWKMFFSVSSGLFWAKLSPVLPLMTSPEEP